MAHNDDAHCGTYIPKKFSFAGTELNVIFMAYLPRPAMSSRLHPDTLATGPIAGNH
jgi:hypothetical protein